MVYNKLVRDKIPQIIAASGKNCVTEVLQEDAYLQKLDEKLSEELAEYQESKSLEELADLQEVMAAVVKARGYTWEELERRLVTRGTDAPEKIAQRLRQARVELENAGEYDYMVVNETVEEAAKELAAILCAEHCRVDDERLEKILKK